MSEPELQMPASAGIAPIPKLQVEAMLVAGLVNIEQERRAQKKRLRKRLRLLVLARAIKYLALEIIERVKTKMRQIEAAQTCTAEARLGMLQLEQDAYRRVHAQLNDDQAGYEALLSAANERPRLSTAKDTGEVITVKRLKRATTKRYCDDEYIRQIKNTSNNRKPVRALSHYEQQYTALKAHMSGEKELSAARLQGILANHNANTVDEGLATLEARIDLCRARCLIAQQASPSINANLPKPSTMLINGSSIYEDSVVLADGSTRKSLLLNVCSHIFTRYNLILAIDEATCRELTLEEHEVIGLGKGASIVILPSEKDVNRFVQAKALLDDESYIFTFGVSGRGKSEVEFLLHNKLAVIDTTPRGFRLPWQRYYCAA